MGEGKGRRRQRVTLLVAFGIVGTAPAVQARDQTLAEGFGAVSGWTMGALMECGTPESEVLEASKRVFIQLDKIAHGPIDLRHARRLFDEQYSLGADQVQSGKLTCDQARANLSKILDAISVPAAAE